MTSVPLHCQLREVISKIQQCQHSLNRTVAAVHTWVIEGDLPSIDNECASIKSSAIAAMETLWADLHSILHRSRDWRAQPDPPRAIQPCYPVSMDTPRAKVTITSTATSASPLDDFVVDEPEWRM